MLANFNDNTMLGANTLGQGSVIAVIGAGAASLAGLWAAYARGLFWGLGIAIALLKRKAAATTAAMRWCPTLRPAVCWTNCSTQRHVAAATMSGVVVDPGTVGVRW